MKDSIKHLLATLTPVKNQKRRHRIRYDVKVGKCQKNGGQDIYLDTDVLGEYGFLPGVRVTFSENASVLALVIHEIGTKARQVPNTAKVMFRLPPGNPIPKGVKRYEADKGVLIIFKNGEKA